MPRIKMPKFKKTVVTAGSLKDHVTTHKTGKFASGGRITRRFKSQFGFSMDDFKKAIMGDETLLKSIGQAARDGELAMEFMPRVTEAFKTVMQATGDYNESIAELIDTGAKNLQRIDRSKAKVQLATQKYTDDQKEQQIQFINAFKSEDVRHNYAMNYIRLKAYIDQYLQQVDGNAKLLQTSAGPQLKQMDADRAYKVEVGKHYLDYGNDARPDLIPQKNYAKPGNPVMSAVSRFRAVLGF